VTAAAGVAPTTSAIKNHPTSPRTHRVAERIRQPASAGETHRRPAFSNRTTLHVHRHIMSRSRGITVEGNCTYSGDVASSKRAETILPVVRRVRVCPNGRVHRAAQAAEVDRRVGEVRGKARSRSRCRNRRSKYSRLARATPSWRHAPPPAGAARRSRSVRRAVRCVAACGRRKKWVRD
jgi:hypothetical protein